MQNSPFSTSEATRQHVQGFAPFALGFRPFFVCAGISAVVLLGLWLAFWSQTIPGNTYYGVIGWHSHEMLFGYTTAVIAGFLLTAVRNWTGIDTITGKPLAGLASLWLAGRILPLLPGPVPGPLIAIVDLAFLPLLTMVLIGPLMKGENRFNRIFIPALGATVIANLLVHLQALGLTETTAAQGVALMRNLILLLILVISGRVVPFFTRSAIAGAMPTTPKTVENVTAIAFLAYLLAELLFPQPKLMGVLAGVLAVTQIIRIVGWHDRRIWSIPILWVLYSGYFWIIVGFLLQTLVPLGLVAPNLALHALTLGGIGVLTLGMMSRVALGHSGRPIRSAPIINLTFVLMNIAAAIRVLAPIVLPQQYSMWIHLSGGLWLICFTIFCAIYVPILIRPRIDGKPG